jgi:hypothetical protein
LKFDPIELALLHAPAASEFDPSAGAGAKVAAGGSLAEKVGTQKSRVRSKTPPEMRSVRKRGSLATRTEDFSSFSPLQKTLTPVPIRDS